MTPEFKKLSLMVRKWGGTIKCIPLEEFNNAMLAYGKKAVFMRAPFTSEHIGINFERKQIVYCKDNHPTWPSLLHEMGHVFATTIHPYSCPEIDFFGWEYCLVKHIEADTTIWDKNNRDYAIQFDAADRYYDGYGELLAKGCEKDKRKFLQEKIKVGLETGILIKKKGEYLPVAIR